MIRSKARTVLLLTLIAGAAWGCGETTTPTLPTPVYVNETLTGTVAPGETKTHTFEAKTAGYLTIGLSTVDPATLVFGVSVGTWKDNVCTVTLAMSTAQQAMTLTASLSAAGTYCVNVYDVGKLADGETMTYTFQVAHP